MLGLSFGKLLLLAIVVGVVWFGFRYLTGLGQAVRQGQAAGGVNRAARRAPAIEAEDMTACARCGTYVSAAKPSACSRADCPYRR